MARGILTDFFSYYMCVYEECNLDIFLVNVSLTKKI
jgi:hypothetical protein